MENAVCDDQHHLNLRYYDMQLRTSALLAFGLAAARRVLPAKTYDSFVHIVKPAFTFRPPSHSGGTSCSLDPCHRLQLFTQASPHSQLHEAALYGNSVMLMSPPSRACTAHGLLAPESHLLQPSTDQKSHPAPTMKSWPLGGRALTSSPTVWDRCLTGAFCDWPPVRTASSP